MTRQFRGPRKNIVFVGKRRNRRMGELWALVQSEHYDARSDEPGIACLQDK